MAIFSKYAAVLEADGSPMSVQNGSAAHQPLPGRRRFRPRHPVLPALVRAARLEGRPVRRGRHAGARQGHQRRRCEARGRAIRGGGVVRLLQMGGLPERLGPRRPNPQLPVWEALHQLIRVLKRRGRERRRCRPCRRSGQGRSDPSARLSPLHAVRARRAGPRMLAPTTKSITSWSAIESAALRPRSRSRRPCLDRKEASA